MEDTEASQPTPDDYNNAMVDPMILMFAARDLYDHLCPHSHYSDNTRQKWFSRAEKGIRAATEGHVSFALDPAQGGTVYIVTSLNPNRSHIQHAVYLKNGEYECTYGGEDGHEPIHCEDIHLHGDMPCYHVLGAIFFQMKRRIDESLGRIRVAQEKEAKAKAKREEKQRAKVGETGTIELPPREIEKIVPSGGSLFRDILLPPTELDEYYAQIDAGNKEAFG